MRRAIASSAGVGRGGAGLAALWRHFDGRAFLIAQWQAESDLGRPALWMAPAMALGVLLHFSLPAEPPAILLYPLILLGLSLAWTLRHVTGLAALGLFLGAVAAGLLSADIAVRLAAAPRIENVVPRALVTGTVMRIEGRAEKSPRILLQVTKISGLTGPPPARLIAVGSKLEDVKLGQTIVITARLAPLPLPTHPQAYSPGFFGYFNQIGGYAFVRHAPRAAELPDLPIRLRAALAVERWRTGMSEAIIGRLGPRIGPLAAALVTGQRTAIPDDINQQFNASGLLHVLSISGLHMALVAGGALWLARALLAAIPLLALHVPVKKAAALIALSTASFYEIASGAEVATTRSYIMIVIVFLAILLDRPAITMRNLAISALIILAIQPSALISPSFQMSYAATAVLVAVYERKLLPPLAHPEQSAGLRLASRIAEAILATAIISVLVEVAMLPITLHHFHRIAWFGVVGNLLATALVDTIVMPMAVLTLAALQFGNAPIIIDGLGFAVERMLDIARFVSSFPHALSLVAGFGTGAMLVAVLGVMWACFWRGPLAVLGLLIYLAGVAIWLMEAPPDLYVSASGRLVAARDGSGLLRADGGKADGFALSRWLEANGDARRGDDISLGEGRACDFLGCTLHLGRDRLLAIAKAPEALKDDCARADILLIPYASAPPDCPYPRLVLDQNAIRRAAGLIVRWNGGAPIITSNAADCGTRPWCPSTDIRSRDVWWQRPKTQ